MGKDLVYLAHLPQWDISQPPMGISYIGAYLKSKGIEVFLSDFSIELYKSLPPDFRYYLDNGAFHTNWIDFNKYTEEVAPFIDRFINLWMYKILKKNPKIIGFSVLTTNINPTLELIKRLKKIRPEIIIVLGGPYVTRYEGAFKVVENKEIDFIVPDEGEEVMAELVQSILGGKKENLEIKGLIYKDEEGSTIDTGQRELIENINEIPYPLYSMYPAENYDHLAIPILGSRGCIFQCAFCSETVLWKRFRFRSAENIVDEIKHHLKTFDTNYFYIVDSLVNGNMKELIRMCELIIEQKIKIKWGGKASIRTQMTKEVLELMAKSGCTNIQYGIESGSPKVVREMRKGFTIPIAKRVLKDSHDVGINTGCFFLIGFPTETEEDYEQTKEFIKEVEPYLGHLIPGYGMGILPGSEVHDNPEKFGIKYRDDGEWETEYVNPETLKRRVEDFRNFCSTLDISIS